AARDIEMVIIPGPQQVAAFEAAQVDALFAHTPYLETVMVRDGGVLLVNTSGGEVPSLAGGQIHALATTPDRIRQDPALIRAATRAIARAQRLIRSDLAATVDALIASGATGTTERRQIEAIAAIYAAAVPATPAISIPGIERAATRYPAHPRAP